MDGKFEITVKRYVIDYNDMVTTVRQTKEKFEKEFKNIPVRMDMVVNDDYVFITITDETWRWTEEIMNFFKPMEIPKEIGEH